MDLSRPSWIDGVWASMNGMETRTTGNAERWSWVAVSGNSLHSIIRLNRQAHSPHRARRYRDRSQVILPDLPMDFENSDFDVAGNVRDESVDKLRPEIGQGRFPFPSLAPQFRFGQRLFSARFGSLHAERGRAEDGQEQFPFSGGKVAWASFRASSSTSCLRKCRSATGPPTLNQLCLPEVFAAAGGKAYARQGLCTGIELPRVAAGGPAIRPR